MKNISIILITVLLSVMCLATACSTDSEDSFRIVDYSYILQNNTDHGPEFAFYMYAYSYIKGPITDFQISSADLVPHRKVQTDLFENIPQFGSFESAADVYTVTAQSLRSQSVTYTVNHTMGSKNILGDISVDELSYEDGILRLTFEGVDNANYYGFFAIPVTYTDNGTEVLYRALAGRPVAREALPGQIQVFEFGIDMDQYEHGVVINPVAINEGWDAGRIILDSGIYFRINK